MNSYFIIQQEKPCSSLVDNDSADSANTHLLTSLTLKILYLQLSFSKPDRKILKTLTHFNPVPHFYTSWKRQKIYGFLTFSGGIVMWHWTKMGLLFSRKWLFIRSSQINFVKVTRWWFVISRCFLILKIFECQFQ